MWKTVFKIENALSLNIDRIKMRFIQKMHNLIYETKIELHLTETLGRKSIVARGGAGLIVL